MVRESLWLGQSARYQICVLGHVPADRLTDWPWPPQTHYQDDTTLLTLELPDQAALFGTLRRIRDLGMPLMGVECLDTTTGEQS